MPVFRGKPDPKQRQLPWEQSTTIESFIQHAEGKTLEELRVEAKTRKGRVGPLTYEQGLGPRKHRYLRDPLDLPKLSGEPGGVIDMRHFIEAALFPLGLGEWAGAAVEKHQGNQGFDSSHYEEDYKSNFLGVVFRNNYWKRDHDISDEFQRFFSDYSNGKLKGFIPAVERAIEQIKQQGAGGLRQLQQLRELFEGYRQRLQSFQPQTELQNLNRQFIAAEQALEKLASTPQPPRPNFAQQTSHSLTTPRQLLQAHAAVKEMRRWQPWLPKMKDAEQLAATYREQRQEHHRLQQAEEQAHQALASLETRGSRSLLNPGGVPAEQLVSARRQAEWATLDRQNYEREFHYTEGRVQEYMQMAKDHEQWQQSPQTQALMALEQQLQQPELAQQLQQAHQLNQLFSQGLSAAEFLGRPPAYQQALDQAQAAYLETGELPSETMLNAIQQDLMYQQAELGGLELG